MYSIASFPHIRTDTRAMATLAKASAAYREAGSLMPGRFRVLTIPHAGTTFEGYLHIPPGRGPFPVVVASNGSDVVKDQTGDLLRRELAIRGIALLIIDMPGLGGSSNYDLTPETDALHVAAIAHVRTQANIDPTRVAAMGLSFGGNAAARLFLRPNMNLRAVVSSCGPLHSAFVLPPLAYRFLPPLTIDGARDRLGLAPGASDEILAERMRGFSLQTNPTGSSNPVSTPLLILASDQDPVAPLSDLGLLMSRTEKADKIVSFEPGHCPSEAMIAATAAAWLSQYLQP